MDTRTRPIYILKEGTKREKGKDLQHENIMVARTIADVIKTTLGPRGMDKMMVSPIGDILITNDGATILKELNVQNPAAKMIIEVAKAMDQECGDGTTSAVLLVGEILEKADNLIDANLHPTVIARGLTMAMNKALEIIDEIATDLPADDRPTLERIARTAMMSKAVTGSREQLASMAVDAVMTIAEKKGSGFEVDLENIQIVKRQGGSMSDTALIEGMIIDKGIEHVSMPKVVKRAKIALITSTIGVKKTEVDANIQITEPGQLHAFLDEEEHYVEALADRLKDIGANVVICQKSIDDLALHHLARLNIYAVQKVKASDIEKLSKATGGNIVDRPDHLEKVDLGKADLVEERRIEEDKFTFITGCHNPKAISILVRGGTEHVIAEIERSVIDGLSDLKIALHDGKCLTGAGATAMELSYRLREYSSKVSGREQMVIAAFASALEGIPIALAENAGLDPVDIIIELRKAHATGEMHAGLNVFTGKVMDMREEGVIEPVSLNKQIIKSSTEAAVMIVRIDDMILSKGGGPPEMPPGGMGEG